MIRSYDGPLAGGLAPRTLTKLHEYASGLWWEENLAVNFPAGSTKRISKNKYGTFLQSPRLTRELRNAARQTNGFWDHLF